MQVFVAGATGVLGRRIVRQFVARGHAVVGLVRDDAGERTVRSLGGEPRRADLFNVESLRNAMDGCEVVLRAATSIPTRLRTSPKHWAMNDRIRREGTRALTAAAVDAGARAFLQESVVWVVRNPGGGPFDEGAPPADDPILRSALDAERIGREAAAAGGLTAAVLRFGLFYAADAWHTRILGESIARCRPVLLRGTDPVWSLVHADDAAAAFVAASERPRSEVWHVVDDRPARMSEVLGSLRKALAARPLRRMPAWLARLALGPYGGRLLSSSFETTAARFREDYGWRPTYPTYEQGLQEVVASWRSDGFLMRGN